MISHAGAALPHALQSRQGCMDSDWLPSFIMLPVPFQVIWLKYPTCQWSRSPQFTGLPWKALRFWYQLLFWLLRHYNTEGINCTCQLLRKCKPSVPAQEQAALVHIPHCSLVQGSLFAAATCWLNPVLFFRKKELEVRKGDGSKQQFSCFSEVRRPTTFLKGCSDIPKYDK